MKKLLAILSCMLMLPAYGATVVANVNGKPITDTDVTARTTLMAKQGKTATDNRRQALQGIIDDSVKLAYASNFGAVPDDKDVETELKKMNLGELTQSEKAMALSALKSDIAWQMVVARTIVPTIDVTKDDILAEKKSLAIQHGLPVEMTLVRLTDIPEDIAKKLNDMGYMVACESDMHCALTMVLLKSATMGKGKPLFGEFTVRHPENKNAELLWHCGPFAYSLHKEGTPCKVVNMQEWFQVKDGHYTVARIDQDHGNYSIAVSACDSAEGPYTGGTYLWGKFKDLSNVERKLIEGPYIHHMSEIEGDFIEHIREFCKYVPGLRFDRI